MHCILLYTVDDDSDVADGDMVIFGSCWNGVEGLSGWGMLGWICILCELNNKMENDDQGWLF